MNENFASKPEGEEGKSAGLTPAEIAEIVRKITPKNADDLIPPIQTEDDKVDPLIHYDVLENFDYLGKEIGTSINDENPTPKQ